MAKAPSGAAFATSDDYSLLLVVVTLVGLGVTGWLLWQEQHAAISAIAMQALHWQMRFLDLFTDRFEIADAQVLRANPAKVTFPQLANLAREIGRFFLYPAVAFVAGLAGVCLFYAPPARFSRELDLEGLMREQARSFGAVAAFVGRRLGLASVREGEPRPCDLGATAEEWLARWATDPRGGFDEAAARAELQRQLGGPWRGIERAPAHMRCMLAVIALHAADRREEALGLLGDLSGSLPKDGKDGRAGPEQPLAFPRALVSAADAVLAEPQLREMLLAVMDRHGFETPAAMSALVEARSRAGVLAPAQFAFLKLVDRRLWYALHSLGFSAEQGHPQPNPRVEAVGARDHWAAERQDGGRLRTPSIDRALAALRVVGERRGPKDESTA